MNTIVLSIKSNKNRKLVLDFLKKINVKFIEKKEKEPELSTVLSEISLSEEWNSIEDSRWDNLL